MLEHLGLGIVLDLEDNFTPQANTALASFDRLQSGAEEMQENIGKSLSNLQNLMLSGFSLDTIGESVKNAGKGILNTFKNLGNELVNTNSKFDTLKAQMLTVFGSIEETNKKLEWASEFAIKTPFDVEGTVRAMQMMKSQGLDVTQEFKNAKGEMKSFLEYMGDFATRNMSSTGGFEGMAYAISNALGGDFTSIRKRFDLSKTESDNLKSIFETEGIDAFAQAFTEMADRLTPNAMKNMLGTWDQIIAEMEDTWGVFLWKVGDTGAFDDIKKTLTGVSQAIGGLTSEGNIKAFGEIVSSLWKPIDFLVRGVTKVVQAVLKFTEAHPQVAKLATGFVAVTGVVLTLTGVLMKATGGVMIFVTSLVSAWANLSVLGSLGVASNLTGLTTGLMSVVKWLGLAGVAVGAFALAWHNNFMGIRDRGLTVFNQLKEAWSMSEVYFDKDFDVKYKKQLNMEMKLDTTGSMKQLNNVAYKIAQFRALASGIFKALFRSKGENGKVFFTDEEIAIFQNTGILLTIQKIVALRERVVTFFKGFGEGIGTVVAIGKQFIDMVLVPIKGFFHAVGVNLKPIKEFFDSIFGFKEFPIPEDVALRQLENLKKLGKAVGAVFGAVMGFKLVSSITSFIVSPFKKLFDSLVKVKDTVGSVKDSILGMKDKTINVVANTLGLEKTTTDKKTVTTKKPSVLQTIFGKTDKGTYAYDDAKEYAKSQIRNPILTKAQKNTTNHKGFTQVYGSQMDESYYDMRFRNGRDDVNANRIFVSNTNKLKETLFGRKYYTESQQDGKSVLTKRGTFGGLFNVENSDDQIRLATQEFRAKGGVFNKINPLSVNSGYYQLNKDGSKGKHISYDFKNPYEKYIVDEKDKLAIANNKKGERRKPKLKLNEDWVNKQKEIDAITSKARSGKVKLDYGTNASEMYQKLVGHAIDKDSVVGKLKDFGIREQRNNILTSIKEREQQVRDNALKIAGVDGRKFNAKKYINQTTVDPTTGEKTTTQVLNPTWEKKQMQKKKLINSVVNKDEQLKSLKSGLVDFDKGNKNKNLNQDVYKASRSKMSEFLFGQKFYKIDEDENGNLYRNTVARRGGVLRRGGNLLEKDSNGVLNRDKLIYNEEGDTRFSTRARRTLGTGVTKVKESKPVQAISKATSSVMSFGSRTKDRVVGATKSVGSRVANTRLGQLVSSPYRAYKQQMSIMGNASSKSDKGFSLKGLGTKLFGRGTRNEATGKMTGGGIFTKLARGTGSVLGTTAKVAKSGVGIVGRTAGLLGRGAIRMLPGAMAVGAIGSAFYKGVANKGANIQGEDRAKLIKDAKLAPDASNFTVGLAQFKKELKNVDVKSLWTKIKTEGKNAWGIITDIGKDMWAKIKENGSTILGEAFEGIKGLGSVAWEWLKTDGVDLFMDMATSAMELLGKAFSWLGENAGTIFGGIAEFVTGTVLPKLLEGVTKLGKYIITHIPEILTSLVGIASGIFQGLLSTVTGIFSGIADFLWNAIKGAFSGIGKFLLSALAVPIRAIPVIGDPVADALGLPVHHQGLWMSEEEHPAIIRKDETVLPPDISKKFNSIFNTQSDIMESKKETKVSNQPTSVDNSIKIDKVEIVVKADKLSRSDAREQAKMILEEIKKMKNENKIRAYV